MGVVVCGSCNVGELWCKGVMAYGSDVVNLRLYCSLVKSLALVILRNIVLCMI